MNDGKDNFYLRCALYTFGLVIVIAALIVLLPSTLRSGAGIFITFGAISLYLFLFTPIIFGREIGVLTASRIVFGGMFWGATCAYTALSLFTMWLALVNPTQPIGILVILQLVGIFGVMATVLVGGETSSHIREVAYEEDDLLAPIQSMREVSEDISIRAYNLKAYDVDEGTQQQLSKSTARIAEELRYLAPSRHEEARSLEHGIEQHLSAINVILRSPDITNRDLTEAYRLASSTEDLISRRKAIRD